MENMHRRKDLRNPLPRFRHRPHCGKLEHYGSRKVAQKNEAIIPSSAEGIIEPHTSFKLSCSLRNPNIRHGGASLRLNAAYPDVNAYLVAISGSAQKRARRRCHRNPLSLAS